MIKIFPSSKVTDDERKLKVDKHAVLNGLNHEYSTVK